MRTSQIGPSGQMLSIELDELEPPASEATLFEEEIFPLVSGKEHPTLVLIDYKGRRSMSSEHLGYLVRLNHHLQARGGELLICGLDDRQERLLHLTALDAFVRILHTRQEALAAIEEANAAG